LVASGLDRIVLAIEQSASDSLRRKMINAQIFFLDFSQSIN
jgi:hypothetical protein